MPWVTIANVKGPKGDKGDPGLGSVESLRIRPLSDLPSLNVNQWIGLLNIGLYAVLNGTVAQTIINRPTGSDLRAMATVKPLASGVSVVTWQEMDGAYRTFEKVISSTSANNTPWKRLDRSTRRVLHQLSQPGNGNLRDSAPTRHARIPVRMPVAVDRWDLVLKNFNEQTKINYGDLDFAEIFIGKALKTGAGGLTPNFDGPPTSLGLPQAQGSGTSRRYVISGISFTLEAGVEYLLSYGYTNPNTGDAHMGIGGAWLGADPSMTGRYDPPVSNSWSPNTPLDVYLTLHAPTEVTVNAYIDSSTGTGQGANHPLRDCYGWKHAESVGALPVLLGHSGSTLGVWADASRYVWSKLASSFDRVDATYNGLGSNDDYGGATLAQNKSDATALAQLIRTHLSDSLMYLTTFPRRTETAAVKASRRARNEYFAGLPDKASACIDRSEAVSGPDGLMRPDLDSGDGTHLNTLGQGLLSGALIRGAEYVAKLNRYTVSETAGRVIKAWDYLNNREQLIYGDTGWRNIDISNVTGTIRSASSPGTMHLRREGGTVTARFAGVGLTSGTTQGNFLASGTIPVEFRGVADGSFFSLRDTGIGFAMYHTLSVAGSYVRWLAFWDGVAQSQTRPTGGAAGGEVSWHTDAPWPTSLPGTAVGTIPYQ